MLLALSPALFGWPVITLVSAFVKLDLNGGAQDLGLLLGMLGAGSLVGAMTSIFASEIHMKGRVIIIALLAYGGMMLLLSATRSFVAAAAVLSLIGFCQAMYFAFNHSIVQLIAPSEIRGRVMSIWMITWGLTPVGLMPISTVAERLGTPLAFALAGSMSLVLVLSITISSRGLWNLRADAAAE